MAPGPGWAAPTAAQPARLRLSRRRRTRRGEAAAREATRRDDGSGARRYRCRGGHRRGALFTEVGSEEATSVGLGAMMSGVVGWTSVTIGWLSGVTGVTGVGAGGWMAAQPPPAQEVPPQYRAQPPPGRTVGSVDSAERWPMAGRIRLALRSAGWRRLAGRGGGCLIGRRWSGRRWSGRNDDRGRQRIDHGSVGGGQVADVRHGWRWPTTGPAGWRPSRVLRPPAPVPAPAPDAPSAAKSCWTMDAGSFSRSPVEKPWSIRCTGVGRAGGGGGVQPGFGRGGVGASLTDPRPGREGGNGAGQGALHPYGRADPAEELEAVGVGQADTPPAGQPHAAHIG